MSGLITWISAVERQKDPQERHLGDTRGLSPISMTSQLGPSINTKFPDDKGFNTRDNHPGRYRSRNPGSALQPEQKTRPSLTPSSTAGYLGEKVYQYSELRPLEIRLIRILPARMAAIKCTIAHYSLAEAPAYVANSYAWGDADDKRQIQVDGVRLPISASLFGAFSAVREKGNDVWCGLMHCALINKTA